MSAARLRFVLLVLGLLWSAALWGRFDVTARDSCAAWNNLHRSRNSGAVHLIPGRSYRVYRRHKGRYLIKIPGADPSMRWVDPSCFAFRTSERKQTQKRPKRRDTTARTEHRAGPTQRGRSVLVLSWENAFCQTHRNRKECRPLFAREGSRLVLHGLWPQPRNRVYCSVPSRYERADRNRRWGALPEPELSARTRALMKRYMPGTLSRLHRHEWIKHGTCYSDRAQEYFRDALALTRRADETLGAFLRGRIGRSVTLAQLRRAAERLLGPGAGRRIAMECRHGLLTEIRIALAGRGADLYASMADAPTLRPRCRQAVVDAPGYRR